MVWHAAHVSPLHSVDMSEGAKHTSSRLGTQSTMRNQIPGPGREAKGIPYLTEWRLSFSFSGAGPCQRELWILNLEGSSSIYYFQIWESKARSVECHQGREKAHLYKLDCGPAIFLCQMEGNGAGQNAWCLTTRNFTDTLPTCLTNSVSSSQTKWEKKKIEITKRTAEILAGQLMSDRSVTHVKKIKRGKKKNGFVKNSEVL